MKLKITFLVILLTTVICTISAQPKEVLNCKGSLRFIPSEFSKINKPIAYNFSETENLITIYDENLKKVKTFEPVVPKRGDGNCQVEATVKITGVKSTYSFIANHVYNFTGDYDYGVLTASTSTEMAAKLQKTFPGKMYWPFTDVDGRPACYEIASVSLTKDSLNHRYFMYDTYKEKYPFEYYTIENSMVSRRITEYALDYDLSEAIWTEIPGTRTTYNSPTYVDGFRYRNQDTQSTTDESIHITQTLFNDDENWEYIVQNYTDTLRVSQYSTPSIKEIKNGNVILTQSASISSVINSSLVKNDKGETILTLPPYEIERIIKFNNKFYIEVRPSGTLNYFVMLLDKKGSSSIKGDVNGDGVVNMSDANEVVNMYLKEQNK